MTALSSLATAAHTPATPKVIAISVYPANAIGRHSEGDRLDCFFFMRGHSRCIATWGAAAGRLRGRGGNGARPNEARQNRFPRSKRLDSSVRHEQNLINSRQNIDLVRNNRDCRARRLQFLDGREQRFLAGRVKVGVRLVEHDQARIAIKRARQTDPLTLPARERLPALADLGIISLR